MNVRNKRGVDIVIKINTDHFCDPVVGQQWFSTFFLNGPNLKKIGPRILISTEPLSKVPLSLVSIKLLTTSQKGVTRPDRSPKGGGRINDRKELRVVFIAASGGKGNARELHYREQKYEKYSVMWANH